MVASPSTGLSRPTSAIGDRRNNALTDFLVSEQTDQHMHPRGYAATMQMYPQVPICWDDSPRCGHGRHACGMRDSSLLNNRFEMHRN